VLDILISLTVILALLFSPILQNFQIAPSNHKQQTSRAISAATPAAGAVQEVGGDNSDPAPPGAPSSPNRPPTSRVNSQPSVPSAPATTWQHGDVFVGTDGAGQIRVYSNGAIFKEALTVGFDSITGCAFDANDKLYVTDFNSDYVKKIESVHPHGILQTIYTGSWDHSPESITFAANGDFYVGNANGNGDIHKYNAGGVLQNVYDVEVGPRGSDWIELSADQRTIFYTSEGPRIRRYDVVSSTQLTDFATNVGTYALALRLLPPGDGSGGLIVANWGVIRLLSSTGSTIRTYDASGAVQCNGARAQNHRKALG
jgi:WD40 repeat protein